MTAFGWTFYVSFYQTWADLWPPNWGRWNWCNFTPIHIELEWGGYKGKYAELTVVLLGLGFVAGAYSVAGRDAFVGDMEEKWPELFADDQ